MIKNLLTLIFIFLGLTDLAEGKIGESCSRNADCDKGEICVKKGSRTAGVIKKHCQSPYPNPQ